MSIEIRVKAHSRLTGADLALSAPLREIAQYLASTIFMRQQQGMGALGPNAPYAPRRKGQYWVAPDAPQPGGHKFIVGGAGKWAGWAVYRTEAEYLRLANQGGLKEPGRPRTYRKTGELWDRRYAVSQRSPRHVRVHFRGTHKGSGLRADRLARLIHQGSSGILEPSPAEMAQAQAMWTASVSSQLRGALSVTDRGFALRGKVAALGRRIKR